MRSHRRPSFPILAWLLALLCAPAWAAQPTVTVTPNSGSTTSNPISFTVTFSQAVTGFVLADAVASNGSLDTFSGSGTTYSITVIPSSQGAVTLTIPAGAAQNSTAEDNLAGSGSVTYNLPPALAITPTGTSSNVSPMVFTFTFSETVSGFTVNDVTVGNGTKAAAFASVSPGADIYTLEITPSAQGAVTVNVAAGAAFDGLGAPNTAAPTASVTFDSAVPTLVITPNGTTTGVTPIAFTFTFNEAVVDFTAANVTVTNGTKGAFAGSGASYTLQVAPVTTGAVGVSVPAAVVHDAAGNASAGSSATVTYSTTQPVLSITPSGTFQSTAAIVFTFAFDRAVTGFTASDITLTNGSAGALSGSGTTYTLPVTASAQGGVTVDVANGAAIDSSSNPSTPATATVTYDTTKPTITATPAAGAITGADPILFLITFNETVTGFPAGALTATNGTVGAVTGSGTTYTVPVTPTDDGDVVLSIPADAARDAALNGNLAFSRTVKSDRKAPVPTILASATSIAPGGSILLRFLFTESVTGFTASDVVLGGGAVAGALVGSGPAYQMLVTAPAGSTLVTVDLPAGAAVDIGGRASLAGASLAFPVLSKSVEPNPISPAGDDCGSGSGLAACLLTLGLIAVRRPRR
ncbi:MAG: hypothetical protein H0V44_15230 [Planctomycetes bacterium]|nr:hypothetical protein [Planctomycetota bacterium]